MGCESWIASIKSELPEFAREARAGEVAACLKEILDRVELPAWEEIPDTTEIEAAGGLEMLSHWRIPGTRITIARVEEGPQRHEYLFSPGTVGRAVAYYKDIKWAPYRSTGPEVSEGIYNWYVSAPAHAGIASLVDQLPAWMREPRYGLVAWKWLGLVVTLLIAIALIVVAYLLYRSLTKRLQKRTLLKYSLAIFIPIVVVLIPLVFKYVAWRYLTLRGEPFYFISFFSDLTAFLALIVGVVATSNRVAEIIIASPRVTPQGLDAQLTRIVSKLMSLVAAVIIFLIGGQHLGIPLHTLLASAGIGGLAIALGAQDTLKTLFGTLMLMADKPFRAGERVSIKNYDGVVEDIGLRSTKIRLLSGHQTTIPNDDLSRSEIENVGRRPYIRRNGDIRIPLDTPREKIERAVSIIRAALDNHEGMAPEFPPRVFFNEFNPDSFNIRFIYWYHPPSIWDFLAFSEKVNFGHIPRI